MGSPNLTSRLNGRKPAQRNTPLPIWLQRAAEHGGQPAKELAR